MSQIMFWSDRLNKELNTCKVIFISSFIVIIISWFVARPLISKIVFDSQKQKSDVAGVFVMVFLGSCIVFLISLVGYFVLLSQLNENPTDKERN